MSNIVRMRSATPIDKPADAIRAGMVFCPEDRKKEGIIPIRSVMENLNIAARRNTARFGLIINNRWERENAAEYIHAGLR